MVYSYSLSVKKKEGYEQLFFAGCSLNEPWTKLQQCAYYDRVVLYMMCGCVEMKGPMLNVCGLDSVFKIKKKHL